MKLWLDDLGNEPNAEGYSRPVPQGWVHAKTFKEAQRLTVANKGKIEDMSLDHDLGTKIEPCLHCENEPTPCEDCGCHHRPMNGADFVAWLIGSGHEPAKKPGVHSANQVGATTMRKMLDHHYGEF